MENNKYRNTNDIDDTEYRRMRKAEDSSYEYHGVDAEDIDEANADNGYPEVVEHNESGSVYDLKTDFIVLLPDEIIRIPQDSNLAWMTMFYALPRELVEKRPAYLELPRNITLLLASEKHMKLIGEDAFLELVWDCYAWAIWQAIQVSDGKGGYVPLNGNQTGALLIAYMARSMDEKGTLPKKAAMIKSIVTGNFGRVICENFGIRVFDALTGFKNICGVIPRAEDMGYTYFFGYEESIGCAPGVEIRDKDGICASMLIMELAAWCRKNGMTLLQYLDSLYKKYGYYAEDQVSLVLKGIEGAERIGRIMDVFRGNKPGKFGRFIVDNCTDYINGHNDVPASNVLIYKMTDGNWFAMRPSGTEPKIKFYFYAKSDNMNESQELVRDMRTAVAEMVHSIE